MKTPTAKQSQPHHSHAATTPHLLTHLKRLARDIFPSRPPERQYTGQKHNPTFLVRRGDRWVDPNQPFPPSFTPAGIPPTDHHTYTTWLHNQHLSTMPGTTNSSPNSNSHGGPYLLSSHSISDSTTLHSAASSVPATTKSAPSTTSPAKTDNSAPPRHSLRSRFRDTLSCHLLRRRRRHSDTAPQPTFRVYMPTPLAATHAEPPTAPHLTLLGPSAPPASEGIWVSYPSILLNESPAQRSQRIREENAMRKRLRDRSGRRCQPCIPTWVVVVGCVALPFWLVGVGVLGVGRWVGRRMVVIGGKSGKVKRGEMKQGNT